MDAIYKTYRAEVKAVNVETGEVDLFIPVSSNKVDRDGDVIEPAAFRKTLREFMKRPVLVASHDYKDLTQQIGEWTRLKITDDGLEGKPKYYINEGNPAADWGFKLASKGAAAYSIGFIPKEWEDGDGVKSPKRTFKNVELLEISHVIIPSNREAMQSIRSKSADPVITQLIDDIEHAEIVDLTNEPLTEEPKHKKPTQGEVKDELDYLETLIKEAGISDENKEKAISLAKDILSRFPGSDKPVEDNLLDTIKQIINKS